MRKNATEIVPVVDQFGRLTDDKGRLRADEMTDREMLEEITIKLRQTEDMIVALTGAMKDNPMLSMFLAGMGG